MVMARYAHDIMVEGMMGCVSTQPISLPSRAGSAGGGQSSAVLRGAAPAGLCRYCTGNRPAGLGPGVRQVATVGAAVPSGGPTVAVCHKAQRPCVRRVPMVRPSKCPKVQHPSLDILLATALGSAPRHFERILKEFLESWFSNGVAY